MIKFQWFIIGILLLISGCFPSTHALYSVDKAVFEESLIGYSFVTVDLGFLNIFIDFFATSNKTSKIVYIKVAVIIF